MTVLKMDSIKYAIIIKLFMITMIITKCYYVKERRQNFLPLTITFHKSSHDHLKGSVTQLVTFADVSQN